MVRKRNSCRCSLLGIPDHTTIKLNMNSEIYSCMKCMYLKRFRHTDHCMFTLLIWTMHHNNPSLIAAATNHLSGGAASRLRRGVMSEGDHDRWLATIVLQDNDRNVTLTGTGTGGKDNL